jgi:AcrR family transcriptional regulator
MEQIAEQAGYTIGAVYSSFASKAELFLAVYESYVLGRVGELESAVAARSPQAGMHRAAEQWMAKLDAEPRWFPVLLEFSGYAAREPELRDRLALLNGSVRLAIARLTGLANREAEYLAMATQALGNGLALQRTIDPASVPDDAFGELLGRLLAKKAERPPRKDGRRA